MRHFTLLLAALLLFAPARAEDSNGGGLPTDALIKVDRQLIRLERLLEQENHAGALEIMEQIGALYEAYDAEWPPDFEYRYAKVAAQAGMFQAALEAINRYLEATGRDGEFYRDALMLLDQIEQSQQNLDLCDSDTKWMAPCWKVVSDSSPRCTFWDEFRGSLAPITWSGSCVYGRAHGEGTLTVFGRSGKESLNETGRFQDGKKTGQWFERWTNGNTAAGPYVNGMRNGHWTLKTADKSRNDGRIQQGRYVNGKEEGVWKTSWPTGETLDLTYKNGSLEGPSVRHLASGHYVGGREEGQFAKNRKQGKWTRVDKRGRLIGTAQFVDGELHGPWRERSLATEGCECWSEGNYVKGKQSGQWTECGYQEGIPFDGGDSRWTGNYVDGVRQGQWSGSFCEKNPQGTSLYGEMEGFFDQGEASGSFYRIDTRHENGEWLKCYAGIKKTYVEGRAHGTGWRTDPVDCSCHEITWENDNRVTTKRVSKRKCRREIWRRGRR